MLKTEEVKDTNERETAKAPVDGQHRLIAMYILEAEGQLNFNEDEMTETIEKPENMSLALFTASINNGRPWNYKDFSKSNLQTGDKRIDYIENQIQEKKLKSDVIYSFYTLGQPEIKANVAKDLKMGINRLPKSLKLNTITQELGDEVLKAFKSSKISESTYNNGRLAKGFKLFYNEYKPDINQIQQLISLIDKDVWFEGQKPDGSAEAKQYYRNFEKWFQFVNDNNSKTVEVA